MRFADRDEAGRLLADRLTYLRGDDVVVLGLPRGGVPVAARVAEALDAPLDVVVVRKLGVPWQPELAMGAVGEGGVTVLEDRVLRSTRLDDDDVRRVADRERAEVERRVARVRGHRDRAVLTGRTAVVVDDGVATGATARAACQVVRAEGAARVVLAVPVAPAGWERRAWDAADELVALAAPRDFHGVGQFYRDFRPTTDEEVAACLRRADARLAAAREGGARGGGARRHHAARPPEVDDHATRVPLTVPVGRVSVVGDLVVPVDACGVVVFAHGSGSSRHSPRNRHVAHVLQRAGLATVLVDLLTGEEAADRRAVFDVGLLAGRLTAVSGALRSVAEARDLPLGFFGASTGAAAALWASTEPGARVRAVVSRGGRPDLAALRLPAVTAPTLLVVGGDDDAVLDLNRRALSLLRCEARLVVVPGATHLFEEPGTLDRAAGAARDWFCDHLPDGAPGDAA